MSKKLLASILYYWGDLEDTFKNKLGIINKIMKRQGNPEITTRLGLLKALTGYIENENVTRIFHLRARLETEVGDYTPEEFEQYSTLMEILSGIDTLLRENKLKDIDDLNMVSRVALATARTSGTSKELPVDFFDNLRGVKTVLNREVTNQKDLEQIYSLTGCLSDTFVYRNGKVECHVSDNSIKDFFVFRSEEDLDSVIKEVNGKDSKFANDLIKCMSSLQNLGKLKYNMLFLTEKYYKVSNDKSKATIKIGRNSFTQKITASNKVSDAKNDINYYVVNYKINNTDARVVLI